MLVLSIEDEARVVLHRDGKVIAMVGLPKSRPIHKVRVTFDAPLDVTIDREEVYVRKYGTVPTLS